MNYLELYEAKKLAKKRDWVKMCQDTITDLYRIVKDSDIDIEYLDDMTLGLTDLISGYDHDCEIIRHDCMARKNIKDDDREELAIILKSGEWRNEL